MNRRRPKAQLELPLAVTVEPPVAREKPRIYLAVCTLRDHGATVWRCGGGLHLVDGRQMTTAAVIRQVAAIDQAFAKFANKALTPGSTTPTR